MNFTLTTFSTEYDWMQMIVERSKTYEFRKTRYPTSVLRIWFYETAPISSLTYICEVDPGLPGDPSNPLPLNGHRNREFNEGTHPDWSGTSMLIEWKAAIRFENPFLWGSWRRSMGLVELREEWSMPPRKCKRIFRGTSRSSCGLKRQKPPRSYHYVLNVIYSFGII